MYLNYFAYGSNLHLQRLLERVSSARTHFVASLKAYDLRFHKLGQDGSGKANAFYTGEESDVLHGVVYKIHREHKPLLDRFEGGYETHQVEVHDGEQSIDAFIYIAPAHPLDDTLVPYHWYQAYVTVGAEQHQLCPHYIERLKSHPAMPDPDSDRERVNLKVLGWIPDNISD
ncbi:MAG: gamma-glutamylcyclotransferase [Gammaproteobacteria bacterium]|nr:gamma-glutamylcyclotransferase [Gammaproteobacteria bacterium]